MKSKAFAKLDLVCYSNEPMIIQANTFKTGIVNRSCDQNINSMHFHLCPPERYARCLKHKYCSKCGGIGNYEIGKQLGVKNPMSWKWTKALTKKYARIHKSWVSQCRPIAVTLKEDLGELV